MNIYLGNLSINQIEKRLGITISEGDREKLASIWETNASNIPKDKWHCFDIPFMIMCGSIECAIVVRDILQKHSSEMKGELQISYK